MTPIEFPEHNVVFAKDQPEYLPLPAHKSSGVAGEVTSCWRPSWKELLTLVWRRKIYLTQLTFGNPLQPIRPSVKFEPEL